MRLDNIKKALENAAMQVLIQARVNLSMSKAWKQNDGSVRQKRIDASGQLYKSLKFTPVQEKNGKLSMEFLMEFYGKFIDQGVSGTAHSTPNPSPFSFKNSGVGGSMQESILQWIKNKNLRLRDLETGKFKKGTPQQYKSLAYVIGRSVKRKGINQTYFISGPFGIMEKQLPAILQKALKADVEQYLKEQFEK